MPVVFGRRYRSNRLAERRRKLSTRKAVHPGALQYYLLQLVRPRLWSNPNVHLERQFFFSKLSMHDSATLDDEELAGHKVAVRAGEEDRCADNIRWRFDTSKRAFPDAAFAPLPHFV